jgi:hypothetical protein
MSFSHGIDADVSIGGSSRKAYVEMIDCTFDRDTADIKALGTDWVQHVQGCRSMRVSLSGPWEATIDGVIFSAFDSDSTTAVIVTPQTGTTYTFAARVTSYKPGLTGSNDKAGWSAELVSDGTVTRA